MKKISLIVFSLLYFSTTALGLTIEEAAEIAVENNNKVRQFRFLTGSQGEKVKSQKSEFLPSLAGPFLFIHSAGKRPVLRDKEHVRLHG